MNKIKTIFLMVGGLIALGSAMTILAAVPLPRGWYIEGGSGLTRVDTNYGVGSSVSANHGQRWNVNAGFKFIPYFALEGGYTRYAISDIRNAAHVTAARNNNYAVDVAAKGIWPLSDTGLDVFAKLGAVDIVSHRTVRNTNAARALGLTSKNFSIIGLYCGGGVSYWVVPNLSVYAQFARSHSDRSIGNLDLYSGGLTYLFG